MGRDWRFWAVLCLGLGASWSYRLALTDFDDDLSGWSAFVTVWLPTAIGLGALIAYVIPMLLRKLCRRRQRNR